MPKLGRARHFRTNVDLGNGKKVDCHIDIDHTGVTVRKYRGRKKYWLSLAEAGSAIARRCQLRVAEQALRNYKG